jgi:hypothetical protein
VKRLQEFHSANRPEQTVLSAFPSPVCYLCSGHANSVSIMEAKVARRREWCVAILGMPVLVERMRSSTIFLFDQTAKGLSTLDKGTNINTNDSSSTYYTLLRNFQIPMSLTCHHYRQASEAGDDYVNAWI